MDNILKNKLENCIKTLSKNIELETVNIGDGTIDKLENNINKIAKDLNIFSDEQFTKENFEELTLKFLCSSNLNSLKNNKYSKLVNFYTRKFSFQWDDEKIEELFTSLMK